jgi:hypothetical protein
LSRVAKAQPWAGICEHLRCWILFTVVRLVAAVLRYATFVISVSVVVVSVSRTNPTTTETLRAQR